MSLLPFAQWCDQLALGHAIHNSPWLFPAIEVVHLLALALLGGTVLIVDLRLWGWGLRQQPVTQLARDVFPWMLAGLAAMVERVRGLGGTLKIWSKEGKGTQLTFSLPVKK